MERQLAFGESHTYEIELQANRYLDVIVDQRGIDVVVIVLAPDGKQILSVDSPNGRQGIEPVKFIAETAGIYKLLVRSEEKGAPAGRYEIRVQELRAAKETDREVIDADQFTIKAEELRQASRYDEALQLATKAVEIRERVLGAERSEVAESLTVLGGTYLSRYENSKAESAFQRAVAIQEKVHGPEHLEVAEALNNLALTYDIKGEYFKAGPLYQRSLTIKEKLLSADNPALAILLLNLAGHYRDRGDYAKAEPFYQRALRLFEQGLGENHANVAIAANNLAHLYRNKGEYAKAEQLFQRALTINEKALGADHPNVATSLTNLALVYYLQGNYQQAKSLFQRAQMIFEKRFGAEHPTAANVLDNLANVYFAESSYDQAEPLIRQALAIREQVFGAENLAVAQSLSGLALFYEAKADTAKAIELLARVNDITERNIALNLSAGSERQKFLYLATFSGYSNRAISLNLQSAPLDARATSVALLSILRTKGRALDAMSDSLALLRRRALPEDQTLIDQLANTRAQLAALTQRTPGRENLESFSQRLKALEEKAEKLENQISAHSAELRGEFQPITLEKVQNAIPSRAALVEYWVYYPFQAKAGRVDNRLGNARYAAYVLRPSGDPVAIELGDVKTIDAKIEAFRKALRDKRRKDVRKLARAVDEEIMKPVRRSLGSARRIFLSPDGTLNLIPFAALVDEHGQYLVNHYLFTYLTSGRDLLRLQNGAQYKRAAVIIANPDFNLGRSFDEKRSGVESRIAQRVNQADRPQKRAQYTVPGPQLAGVQLKALTALPGSAREGKKLGELLKGSTVLTGAAATKAALKTATRPEILHVATHGGFLDDLPAAGTPQNSSRLLVRDDSNSDTYLPNTNLESSLLRSGLFFAGANISGSNGEDGVLTALEATALDLLGTKLVVLSACDTGVGEVKNSEGVYGLRRALVLAGSESQVISLWNVSDQGTGDLMLKFYKRLKAGEGRSAALRNVQLKMLANGKRQHPFYWASFIQSGEWANLDGKRLD